MKTERRHELQTNELAHTLAQWIERVKPYSKAALAALVAVVVVLFSWGFLSAQNSRRAADGWSDYFTALSSPDPRDGLTDIAERFAGTVVGETARLALADIQLDDGTNRLIVDRGQGRKELQTAVETYQAILIESREQGALERATFGLARAYEALGTLEKARETYRSLVSQWPDSPYAATAKSRIKDLEQPDTKGFYDWLAKYEPPRALANEPGKPGARPSFLTDPAEPGGPTLPSVLPSTEGAPSTENPADSAAPSETPADPTGDKPADAAPDAAKPAENPPGAENSADAPPEPPSESGPDKPAEPASPSADAPNPK